MMRRRIYLWMGLGVLFTILCLCANVSAKESYSVQPGDTLHGIAAKNGVSQDALKAANRLKGSRLKVNQILVIPIEKAQKKSKLKSDPASKGLFWTVRKGDTLSIIARKSGLAVDELREMNAMQGNRLKIGQRLALTQGEKGPAASPASEYGMKAARPDLEEEEEESDLSSQEEALAEIERQKMNQAALLGKWSNPDEPKLLVKVAMGFLGAPYRLGGSSVTGIDCSGFVKKIYQLFNIDLPRTAFEQSHIGMRVARGELAEGDLIFFHTRKPVGHVGIYIGNNKFVHASSRKRGVRVDSLSTPYYDRRFIHAVRLKASDSGL